MTTKEYLKGLDDGEEKGAICIICQEKQATVYYDECGHVLYCDDCVEQAVSRNEKCCYCAPDIPSESNSHPVE
jgi:predicted amidophosphoribosyltransferase